MLKFFGTLIIIAGILNLIFVKNLFNKRGMTSGSNNVLVSKRWNIMLATAIVGVILWLIPYLFFWAEPGYQYFLTYPWGTKSAAMEEGIRWRGFAKITPWKKFIEIKVAGEQEEIDDDEIGIMKPIPVRFIDQVTAKAKLATRFQLPSDEASFLKMAVEFRTLENLVNTTLIPTVREVVFNTGYMFAAQDYISGSASDFRLAIDDQLKNGSYSVEKVELQDTIDANIENRDRSINEIRTRYEVKKRMSIDGKAIRIPHEIKENNISVAQVVVDELVLEDVFKQRLEAQRDESAKRQLEQQKIKTAKEAQARIIAEGERDKAAERVEQEKEQVKALIAIETKLKQEETNRSLAEISLKTERLKAEAEKVKADAESYKNAKLVIAGLTPQEKAQFQKETAIGVATELAKIQFPHTMIIGNGKNNGTPLESLIGAAMAKQLTGNNNK
ncbi:MAG: cell envelope integrity protein TolA [Bacteroidales bacterium]